MGLCRGVFVLMSCIVLDAVPRCVCRTSSAFSVVNILIARWQCIRIKCTKPCSNPTSYRSLPMIMSLLCIHALCQLLLAGCLAWDPNFGTHLKPRLDRYECTDLFYTLCTVLKLLKIFRRTVLSVFSLNFMHNLVHCLDIET